MNTMNLTPRARTISETNVGDELPTLTKPVTIVTNFLFGVPFWTAHRLHYDTVSAQDDGFDAPLIPGALMTAYASRVLVSWAGRPDAIRRIVSRNKASAIVGQTIRVAGRVQSVETTANGGLATCELTVTGGDTLLSEITAVVALAPAD
jgi:hydroxyacyl-ACP dehydratase HTD2-like protein with hotdog domain